MKNIRENESPAADRDRWVGGRWFFALSEDLALLGCDVGCRECSLGDWAAWGHISGAVGCKKILYIYFLFACYIYKIVILFTEISENCI